MDLSVDFAIVEVRSLPGRAGRDANRALFPAEGYPQRPWIYSRIAVRATMRDTAIAGANNGEYMIFALRAV
jgi:hypothetical protein